MMLTRSQKRVVQAVGVMLLLHCGCSQDKQSHIQQLEPTDHTLPEVTFAGPVHTYAIELPEDTYLELCAQQLGVDLILSVQHADGAELVRVDAPSDVRGEERLALITPIAGTYRLKLAAYVSTAQPGNYQLTVWVREKPSQQERAKAAASLAFSNALQASEEGRLEQTIEELAAASKSWQGLAQPLWRAHAERLRGDALSRMERYDAAQISFTKAYRDYETAGDSHMQCATLNRMADTYQALGQHNEAETHYEKAVELAHTRALTEWQARSLNNLGVHHYLRGHIEQAQIAYDQALRLWREQDHHYETANTLENYGDSYALLGRLEDARDYYDQALERWREYNNRSRIAGCLMRLAWLHYLDRTWEKAARDFGEVIAIQETLGNIRGEAAARDRLGSVLLEQGRWEAAEAEYLRALKLLAEDGTPLDHAHTHTNLAELYLTRGEPTRAQTQLDLALPTFTQYKELNGRGYAHYLAARIQLEQQQPEAARQQLELAQADLAAMSRQGDRQSRLSLKETRYHYQATHIRTLMTLHERQPQRDYHLQALQWVDHGRADDLAQRLRLESKHKGNQLASLRDKQHALRAQINLQATRIQAAGADSLAQLNRQLRELLRATERLEREHVGATEPHEPMGLAKLQALLDEDSLLLVYHLDDPQSWLWAVHPHKTEVYPLPAGTTIDRLAERIYTELTTPGQGKAGQYLMNLTALSDAVLAPLQGTTRPKRLVLCTDGKLNLIPFQVLTSPFSQGRPLVMDVALTHIPSARVLSLLRQRKALQPEPDGGMLVFADPVFAEETQTLSTELTRTMRNLDIEELTSLPFSSEEARSIQADLPGQVTLFLGARATKQRFLDSDLKRYRYLHLATHGLANTRYPQLSGLVFSLRDEQGNPQAGFLRAHEIAELELTAELVTLSACRTAVGKLMRSEGPLSLGSDFLAAGAKCVLVSLWDIRDESTSVLMAHLYDALLRQQLAPDIALQSASLKMREQPRWQDPHHWAGFKLVGDWQ